MWSGSWGCNLGQSLSNHRPHVFYRRKIRRANRPGKQFNLVIDEEPLDNAYHVRSLITLLKYSFGQALKVRKDNWLQHLGDVALAVERPVWRCITQLFSILSPRCLQTRIRSSWCCRQMRDSSVKTTSFHSATTSFFHRTIGGGDVFGSESRVDQTMDVLWTDRSAVNGVEWYAQTMNDALQTQCAVIRFVMGLSDPLLPCAQLACPHVKWCTEVDVIDYVGPSYPSASNGHTSTLQLFGFVQHDYRFL
ncbi:uncharacterized protein TNCV_951541 [Trichonephila clavipes]|nr:uncharacterized protein TNCV_951541 [Trichonephila clavipes]